MSNETLRQDSGRPSDSLPPLARLVVCERSGQWASALRREWSDEEPRLHETRHEDDAWTELREAAGSCVILEVRRSRLAEVVAWLQRLGREYPAACAIVVGDADLTPTEGLLREAGAVLVHWRIRDADAIVRVARRHMAVRRPADRSWREQFFDRLPWGEFAVATTQ